MHDKGRQANHSDILEPQVTFLAEIVRCVRLAYDHNTLDSARLIQIMSGSRLSVCNDRTLCRTFRLRNTRVLWDMTRVSDSFESIEAREVNTV